MAATSKMMQVVSYDETFADGLEEYVQDAGLYARGSDYNVVAIIGPQSSGKSTLMNLLFGTSFNTMDASVGRYQVTQGVWLGCDVDAPIVVMDLEGTDSRERGEDAVAFERKSALFALALSEVLVINIWTQDVGRFNASNLALLRTILELDLQLFMNRAQEVYKTKLLFVLRDHVGTPLDLLAETLRTDVHNMWNAIEKPPACTDARVEDLFELDFVALPHKVLMPDDFTDAASFLRDRFHDGSMFSPAYSRGVLADGFATYASNVWETVRTNKELDIPSQKKMVAHVRCEHIARESLEGAYDALRPRRDALGVGKEEMVEGLGAELRTVVDSAVRGFEEAAVRYDAEVAAAKAGDVRDRLVAECRALFQMQTAIVQGQARAGFEGKVVELEAAEAPWVGFDGGLKEAERDALDLFDRMCADGEEFSEAGARHKVEEALQQVGTRARRDILGVVTSDLVKSCRVAVKPETLRLLDSATDGTVWEAVGAVVAEQWEATKKDAESRLGDNGIGLNGGVTALTMDKVHADCQDAIRDDVRNDIGSVTSCGMRIMRRFDECFRFDARGVPRSWRPGEDVDAVYLESREKSEALIDAFSAMELFGEKTECFSADEKKQLRDILYEKSASACVEAKRAQEARSVQAKIPIWLVGILIVLGWNEFMAVVRNPYLLAIGLLVLPIGYLVYILDLHVIVWAVVQPMIEQVFAQARQGVTAIAGNAAPPAPSSQSSEAQTSTQSTTDKHSKEE